MPKESDSDSSSSGVGSTGEGEGHSRAAMGDYGLGSIGESWRETPEYPFEFSLERTLSDWVGFQEWLDAGSEKSVVITGLTKPLQLAWLGSQVRNKAPMDFKQLGSRFQAVGNWNYGALGAAMGYPLEFLQRAAGWAQSQAGTSKQEFNTWYGLPPYGDDWRDQNLIEQGFDYFQTHRFELNRALNDLRDRANLDFGQRTTDFVRNVPSRMGEHESRGHWIHRVP